MMPLKSRTINMTFSRSTRSWSFFVSKRVKGRGKVTRPKVWILAQYCTSNSSLSRSVSKFDSSNSDLSFFNKATVLSSFVSKLRLLARFSCLINSEFFSDYSMRSVVEMLA